MINRREAICATFGALSLGPSVLAGKTVDKSRYVQYLQAPLKNKEDLVMIRIKDKEPFPVPVFCRGDKTVEEAINSFIAETDFSNYMVVFNPESKIISIVGSDHEIGFAGSILK